MNPYSIFWLAAAVLLAVCELATAGLVCIWFSAGALGGMIASLLGAPLWLQLLVFAVLSALALLLVRPLAAQVLRTKRTPTNADRVIGQTGEVILEIDNRAGKGQVSVSGQVWSARSEQDTPIPAGTEVRILRIEGVKLFVEPLSPSAPAN